MEGAKTQLTKDAENQIRLQEPCDEPQPATSPPDPCFRRMDGLTKLAVNVATFAYLGLQVPQIVQNITAKDKHALNLAWQGDTTGALGNLLLCTYFTSIKEWAAVRVQAIGCITNFIVLFQIWWAGFCPSVPFFTFAVIIAVGLTIPILFIGQCVPSNVFTGWQEATTAIGLGALLALVSSTAAPKSNMLFGIMGLSGVLVMLLLLLLRPPRLMPLLGKVSGWMATLLFMFMPVPQIVKNFLHHEEAANFNVGFAVLAAIGNGLCTSRALFTKDAIWLTGALWGTLIGGWVTITSVYVAGYVGLWPFLLYTVGLFAYLAVLAVLQVVARRSCVTR